jgi:hypothetical protein
MKVAITADLALPPGTPVRQFEVVDCLGMDQHTTLYRAVSTETDEAVLLMEYMPAGLVQRRDGRLVAAPGEAKRYQRAREDYAKRLNQIAAIGHPAWPSLDELWQEDGTLYGVGRWPLSRKLLSHGALRQAEPDPQLLRRWARTLCDALSSLHERQWIHGNLDIHLMHVRQTDELVLPLIAGQTLAGELPPHVAPEQYPVSMKPGPVGPWTDVYQLSAVMHQLISGAAPPTALQRWEGAALPVLDVDAAPELAGLILATRKGLAMHQDARPQSMAAWLEIAGLPDRRSSGRYATPAAEVAIEAISSQPPDWPARDLAETTSHPLPEEPTPLWVWLCLGIAVAAFLSILVRTF